MIAVGKGFMLPVPDLLQRGFMLQLGVEKPVLVNILFFPEFSAARGLLRVFLMRGFQLFQFFFVPDLFRRGLLHAGSCHLVVILAVIMLVQIFDRLADQLVHLRLFLLFHLLGLSQHLFVFEDHGLLFGLGQVGVFAHHGNMVVQGDHLIRSVLAQRVDLLLDPAHIFVDRPKKLLLLLHRKNRLIVFHAASPPITDILRSASGVLPGRFPSY